ncbi:hypothetical protein [Dankookia sp. P2]|uniref:hypothetical protein n=1 Tax=Dankookia sp. P2 TaxID=3423955 RepID=UPI003D6722DB
MSVELGLAFGAALEARDAKAALTQANANIHYLNGVVDQQAAENAALKARIAALTTQMAVQQADVAGLRAVVGTFKQTHPNSHLLADTGRRFKDGDVKSQATLVYEKAFDTKARELGIQNPEQHRVD